MSYIDNDRRAAVAAVEQIELDKAFQRAFAVRAGRDARDVVKGLSRVFKTDSDTLYQQWLKGEDTRAVLVAGGGTRGEPVWRLGDPPAGVQPLEEHSFLALVEQGVARKAQSRSFFSARSGRSADLGSDDGRLHARDVAAARAHVAAIEEWITTTAVPAGLKQRLQGVRMDTGLRAAVTKAIDTGDPDGLLNEVLVVRRVLRGPDGTMREHTEAKRWDPDTWRHYSEEERPPGLSQATVTELAQRQRIVETAKARWGPEVVEGGDMPPHWFEI